MSIPPSQNDFEMIALEAERSLEQFLYCIGRGFRWHIETIRDTFETTFDVSVYDREFVQENRNGIRRLERTVLRQGKKVWAPLLKSICASNSLDPWPIEILTSELTWLQARRYEMERYWNGLCVPLDEAYVYAWRIGVFACKWIVDVHVNTNGLKRLGFNIDDPWRDIAHIHNDSSIVSRPSGKLTTLVQSAAIQTVNMFDSRLERTTSTTQNETGLCRLETAYEFDITILWIPFLVWIWDTVRSGDNPSTHSRSIPFPFCSVSNMKRCHFKFDQGIRHMDSTMKKKQTRGFCTEDTKLWNSLLDTFREILETFESLCT